jgi:hypothetical protein
MGQRAALKTELYHLAGGGADQTELQLKKTTTALTTLQELAHLPYLPSATCPLNRRNQILPTSQSPGKTISELLVVCQYQDWTPKE